MHLDENLAFPRNRALDLLHPETVCVQAHHPHQSRLSGFARGDDHAGGSITIGLRMQGKKVTKLKAGRAYRFVISDRSSIHNFHLSGRGFNRVLTSVEYTGTKCFVLRLKKGSYRFV
jgi:hypothetical protein